ncbi:MAG TPA: glycosyltransferase family 1 protein, partial [Tepidiformaceae bacterium]|nr:glycosyltransferase family 1 protein [Tepidiformaceae bacterium]
FPTERIRVIPEAPRRLPAGQQSRPDDRPYLLCVGTAEPGKRAVDAIRALAMIPGEARPALVLAGHPGPLSGPLRREAERLGVAGDVEFAGYVEDSALGALIAGATALVFPSLYEGFGLPPLEAMALGTPVIATNAPAMDEVLGTAAAFVPRRDPAAIAREVTRLLADPGRREELRGRGLEQASRYSWTRTADETAAVYREVAA